MAMSTQFSLSLELTKLVPVAPVINVAAKSILNLARQLRRSGSDIVVEEDLADVFGRNRLDWSFASTFKNALGTPSTLTQVSRFMDLVLETTGPTVMRSLSSDFYFSMVVQISMLHYSQELDSLAVALCKALGNRTSPSSDQNSIPDTSTLKRTIKACGTQTSSFRWDRFFEGVESRLNVPSFNATHLVAKMRSLPFPILQALLDCLTAVQHFPEETLIKITTAEGISTIVVWAHCVLGLSVSVSLLGGVNIKFGEGVERIYVELNQPLAFGQKSTVTLFKANTDEVVFTLSSNKTMDSPLSPELRRSAHGYGNYMLSKAVDDPETIRQIGERLVASSVRIANEAASMSSQTLKSGDHLVPGQREIVQAATLLFGNLDVDQSNLTRLMEQPCILTCEWTSGNVPADLLNWLASYSTDTRPSIGSLVKPGRAFSGARHGLAPPTKRVATDTDDMKVLRSLCQGLATLLIYFSMVDSVSDCGNLPLDCLYVPEFPNFSPRRAFYSLASLMSGLRTVEAKLDNASVVSKWGWTIMLGSLGSEDPSDVRRHISIRQGVPTRHNERKEWIIDGASKGFSMFTSTGAFERGYSRFRTTAIGGQTLPLQSLATGRAYPPQIGIEDNTFKVFLRFSCKSVRLRVDDLSDEGPMNSVGIGFRGMQELQWNAFALPPCEHEKQISSSFVVPTGVVVFEGWDLHEKQFDSDRQEEFQSCLHIGMVAGSPAARWVLLYSIQTHWKRSLGIDLLTYVRHEGCCVQCAVGMVARHRTHDAQVVIA